MARRARRCFATVSTAFVRADGALGREVCRADDEVDAMHNSVFRILVTHMMEDARTITPSLELLLVSRNLERVADLATNIGEDAVFLAEGKQIKHHAEGPYGGSRTPSARRSPGEPGPTSGATLGFWYCDDRQPLAVWADRHARDVGESGGGDNRRRSTTPTRRWSRTRASIRTTSA